MITIDPASERDIPTVAALLEAQEQRLYALDNRLGKPRNERQLRDWLKDEFDEGVPLLAHDERGSVRGFAIARYFDLAPDSPMLSFYAPRNGSHRALTFPDPTAVDAQATAHALIAALNHQWRVWQTVADLFTWPSADRWLADIFHNHGFHEDSIIACRPPTPLLPPQPPANLTVRFARPADEEQLIALHIGEVQFHADHIRHVRIVPGIVPDFREKLAKLWAGESPERGAPIVVVAEQDGELVAMAESYLEKNPGWGALSHLPPGRYAYLNSVGVRPDKRGQGIGRALTAGVMAAFAPYHVDAFGLWYMPANPLSSKFWPRMGFTPLWTQFQRRAAE